MKPTGSFRAETAPGRFRGSILAAGFVTMSLSASTELRGQEARACTDTMVTGHVDRGESFEAEFTPGLVFRLDAESQAQNPQGWTIRVTPVGERDSDYSMVATPPYRFSNPRYLNTGYGVTAEAAVAWTPRVFQYVATAPDYEAASAAIGVLLWPGDRTEEQIAEARSALDRLPVYRAQLWIEDASVTSSTADGNPGVVEWIDFRVGFCQEP